MNMHEYIQSLRDVATAERAELHTVIRITNPMLRKHTVFVVSATEPTDLTLPLNVLWVNINMVSEHYHTILRRVDKTPTAPYDHTWVVENSYDSLFQDQYYAPEDNTGGQAYPAASSAVYGLARISVEADDEADPIMVTDDDPRMSDDRIPLPHSHDEQPAQWLATATTPVEIYSGTPVTGAVFRFNGSVVEQRKLTAADVEVV